MWFKNQNLRDIKKFHYTSQLKYAFQLEENMTHVMDKNSLTPLGEQNSRTR